MLRQVRLSFLCRAQFSTSVALSRPESHPINGGLTGSAKLFADAALEEADPESSTTLPRRVHDRLSEQPNWTGDERIEDAVRRKSH
jgi:hypothetical protein